MARFFRCRCRTGDERSGRSRRGEKKTSPQKAETELSAKKWSPVEARQVLETKLDLLRSAKSNDEVLKLKKNICLMLESSWKNALPQIFLDAKKFITIFNFLEDIAGADIEDIYNKIEPKRFRTN